VGWARLLRPGYLTRAAQIGPASLNYMGCVRYMFKDYQERYSRYLQNIFLLSGNTSAGVKFAGFDPILGILF
jgi:hypothetical protein